MSSFRSDDSFDTEEEKFFGMYIGTVVKRDGDLKRVKFQIEGFIEPESPWAMPLSGMPGGSAGVGSGGVPRLGAQVAVWFANGDIERPYYVSANWGEDEIPDEIAGSEDAMIWSGENFAIVIDESGSNKVMRLINRKTGDFIELNANDNTITISATTALSLQATGLIDITAGKVQINGRPVAPIGDPL